MAPKRRNTVEILVWLLILFVIAVVVGFGWRIGTRGRR